MLNATDEQDQQGSSNNELLYMMHAL